MIDVQRPDTIVVSAAVRGLVYDMSERLGSTSVTAAPGWEGFVADLDLEAGSGAGSAEVVVVGLPAAVLKHARSAAADFGFVMPVAQLAAPWQRASVWRDDATLELWRLGWTPLAIDRVLVPVDDATLEFVIGHARRTPPSPAQELR